MSEYKWMNQENTTVMKYGGSIIPEGGFGWDEFQEYRDGGGIVDPFRTFNEWVSNALTKCFGMMNGMILEYVGGDADDAKRTVKVSKALRKETKGQATANDIKILDDNDILDNWLDEMEVAAEGEDHGERWIEASERTEQELIDYDASLVPWPLYPL